MAVAAAPRRREGEGEVEGDTERERESRHLGGLCSIRTCSGGARAARPPCFEDRGGDATRDEAALIRFCPAAARGAGDDASGAAAGEASSAEAASPDTTSDEGEVEMRPPCDVTCMCEGVFNGDGNVGDFGDFAGDVGDFGDFGVDCVGGVEGVD